MSFVAALVCIIALSSIVDDTNALPGMSCVRGCFSNLKDYVISKSEAIKEFQATMDIVKDRYEAMKKSGALEGKEPDDCEKIFKELALEELKNLRSKLETKASQRKMAHEAELENLANEDDMMGACSKVTQCVDEQEAEWDPDFELDEEEELKLLEELEELERLSHDEAMMGWSKEAMQDVKRRTQEILSDLLDNEVRKLALAVVSAYLTGGALGPILTPILASVQAKVLDYLMNCVLDLLSRLAGGKKPEQVTAVAA